MIIEAQVNSAQKSDHLKEDVLLFTEVLLPVVTHFIIFVFILLRHLKLRRAGLFYNRQSSSVANSKRYGLLAWATIQSIMAGLVYFRSISFEGHSFDLAIQLHDSNSRLAFCLSCVFQTLCIFYCWFLLGFEVSCKVNPLWTYTRANFIACCTVYVISVAGIIWFQDNQGTTELFLYMIYMMRIIIVIFLAVYHELNPVNFHTINDELRLSNGGAHGHVHHIQGRSVLKRSRGEFNTQNYTLKVLDQVKMHGNIDHYVVQVFSMGRKIANVEKTYSQFKQFERDLCNYLRDSESNLPTLERGIVYAGGSESSPGDRYMRSPDKYISPQEELRNIKEFCKALNANSDYQDGPFYDYFQIPSQQFLKQEALSRSSVQSGDRSRDDSQNMIAQQSGIDWKLFAEEDSEDYTLYFKVKSSEAHKSPQGHYVYKFQVAFIVQTISDEDVEVEIEKRYSDFVKLGMQRNSKIGLPELPSKRIIQNQANASERMKALCDWLMEVTNSKLYHTSELFDFITLKESAQVNLNKSHFIKDLRSVKACVEGHKSMNASTENFVVYRIKTEVIDSRSQDKTGEKVVERRFRDFVLLHKHLKTIFKKQKKPLPELPSKWTSFLNVEQRMQKLNKYICDLCDYPYILDVMFFRKFVGVSSDLLQNLGSTQIH